MPLYSPTPWWRSGGIIISGEGRNQKMVVDARLFSSETTKKFDCDPVSYEEYEANANLIIKAVNNFDDLIRFVAKVATPTHFGVDLAKLAQEWHQEADRLLFKVPILED